jgi:hypothetical protein
MPAKQKAATPTAANAAEPPQCDIHDEVESWEIEGIRQNVCVNDLPPTEHADGKHYCLFHLPSRDKDSEKFEEIFRARLDSVNQKAAGTEKLPEDKREAAKDRVSYDFRYVWFPSAVSLSGYDFQVTANFRSATFSSFADFISAKFSSRANFSSATFSTNADFRLATFSSDADFSSATFSSFAEFSSAAFSSFAEFSSATFSSFANFSSATFSSDANFSSATFSSFAEFSSAKFSSRANFRSATFSFNTYFSSAAFSSFAEFSSATFSSNADFSSATFYSDAYFISAKFPETSQIFFRETKFRAPVDFEYAVFAGYIAFAGGRGENVFLDDRGRNRETVLNLQNARLEKPERISFHRVRLRPGWFVNVDSRKMVFTDIRWDNLDADSDNSNIAAEIESLGKRRIDEPSGLLEIACRQLGVNAEENNRYEEASRFRYMAMETKRLEYPWQGRFWTLNWWYRFSSGYGESWKRAALVLLGVLLVFGLLYAAPVSIFDYGAKDGRTVNLNWNAAGVLTCGEMENSGVSRSMSVCEGLVHSLYVAALQRPEPKAADTRTRLFIILETIFAPLQAALLALAIRRKFMR